jgi:glyoxylase-like metal-dependent hydrolase (beta-lactamase superfamily II)
MNTKLGDFTLHALDAGTLKLDGGAMFGVVPKTLWQKRLPADELNRITFRMRCLLVETPDALVLIDNGIGNKEDEKFSDIYAVKNAADDGSRTRLEQAIRAAGFSPDDVDVMIDTHLHFDHAGGNTYLDDEGQLRLSFPNARYVVQKGELDWAHYANERTRASYFDRNYDPVMAAGKLDLVEGIAQILPGIEVRPTPGHTPFHQSVVLRSGGQTACFLADVCPTSAHLPLPWIMGYDVEPLVTLESKRALFDEATREQWLLIFEHDPQVAWGRLEYEGRKPVLVGSR